MIDSKLVLITLLIKLGVAAAVSSALTRSTVFKNLLFCRRRTVSQTLGLLAWICIPLTLGVWVRVIVPNFLAADISFEAVIIVAVLLGSTPAMVAGAFLAMPAVLHREYLTLPFNLLVALIFGTYRAFVSEEDVWSFSPFVDLSMYRWIRRNLSRPRVDRQVLLLMLIMGMQLLRNWIGDLEPHRIFVLRTRSLPLLLAICVCAPMVVGIPLKIWNQIRIERKLEEQERLLLEARLDALQRQINPHFLFNTLNSIASLVRFRPEQARQLIVKLASILRVLLQDRDDLTPLREELQFADDYLAIEVTRFGADKLQVVKEIPAETLEILVPSMLLQPLIENSIKHGLEPRIGGGTITLRSRLQNDKLVVTVEDDGVGMASDSGNGPLPRRSSLLPSGTGVGMRNVRERMQVLCGPDAEFEIISRPGRGTRVVLTIPLSHGQIAMTQGAETRSPESRGPELRGSDLRTSSSRFQDSRNRDL
ncbi:MAG TPA: sensor histidine kinase [Acidobacteriaceae bacterium]|nr:sensor histidine kinase [Acidobacteriaceae bacterium]